ncbi:hypothetical protein BJ875DRAFT_538404 [Amylocarpus encephaloides]|uniref:Carrier domain-containing protein n=1 Tax=Amylocarpus encephaloides TaxID=45428 RepID=A0A9P8BYY1_9HELO|nr:hypothetical protein BJ875DRAFT_538404 [Amylocarpus encephaloides]
MADNSLRILPSQWGTGQAAIQVSQLLGAEVFTTDHIFFSRDTSFADGIMRMTKGRGVDVVLNLVSGEKLVATWECIASFGRMIEIGKRDVETRGKLAMYPFSKNTAFATVNIDLIIMELFRENDLRPSNPLDMLSISDLEQALRALQGGKSSGEMVLEIMKGAEVLTSLKTKPSYSFYPNATFVIAGGLGGLGRSIARWLATRGARNPILLSRSGPVGKGKAQELLADLHRKVVRVEAPILMVLKENTNLDFFILLSSAVGVFGNVGQSNYAIGNTYQDTLARFRVSQGEKATSIDLGIVLGKGFVAENQSVMNYFQQLGIMLPFSLEELFALLDFYCDPSLDIPSPAYRQVVTGLIIPSKIIAKGKEVPSSLYEPIFRSMHQLNNPGKSSEGVDEAGIDYHSLFTSSPSLADAGLLLSNVLRKKLSRILSISEDSIELKNRVESCGVDSLVTVELRNWLARDLNADLAVFEISGGATLLVVGLTVAAKSCYRQAAWTKS